VGLIISLLVTSLGGIFSNPLFTLANDAVINTPLLQASTPAVESIAQLDLAD
jgi:NAD(P)H-quinone oxidoreductase subunit 2